MALKLTNNSPKIKAMIDQKSAIFLEEAKSLIASQASSNTKRVTGQLSNSFLSDSKVDKGKNTAYIGSNVKYAPYYEMGTGEYALKGNGRKGGWCYRDPKTGKLVFTRGSQPRRPLYKAYMSKKSAVENRAKEVFKL